MKTRLMILSMAVMAMLTTIMACGDDEDDRYDSIKVPAEYTQAFKAKYPEAVNAKWEQKTKYYVAEFSKPQEEYDVWFGAGAVWAMTEIDYGRNLFFVPSAVSQALAKSEYGYSYTVKDVEEYQRPDDSFYIIEVEPQGGGDDTYLYFRPDGMMVKAIKTDIDIVPETVI